MKHTQGILIALAIVWAGWYVGSAKERDIEQCVNYTLELTGGYNQRDGAASEREQWLALYVNCRRQGR